MSTRTVWIIIFLIFALVLYFLNFGIKSFDKYINSGFIQDFTPDMFGVDNSTDITFQGKAIASKSKVVITGLVRNVEQRIPLIKLRCEALGKLFNDYRVVIVENDSTDKSRELLLEWVEQNSKVVILGCGVNASECKLKIQKTVNHEHSSPRIQKMVHLRNLALDYILENYPNYDYTVVYDLDIVGTVYSDGVWNTLGWMRLFNAGVMCANGISPASLFRTSYYDTYPLKMIGKEHLPEEIYSSFNFKFNENPTQVTSCFGGFAIYANKSLQGSKYIFELDGNGVPLCEHTTFHNTINAKKYVNPNMIYYVLEN